MNKIVTFSVIGLTVEGFKCFADKQHFSFGGINAITGHNGQGKSSIADAISYAITGAPFANGEHSLDRLYTLDSKNIKVELAIDTGDGKLHKLTRSRVNDGTNVTYDGEPVRQSELSDMFGEKDVFLSLFNPLYFIEVLGDKGRNLLERHLPAIPHEMVLHGLSEATRALLENVQMLSPETYLERIRSDIRELESTIIYAEGQRDLLESQKKERAALLQGKTDERSAVIDKVHALEAKRADGVNFSALEAKRADLYMRYDELSHDILTAPDTTEIDTKILAVQTALEKRRAEGYMSKFAQQIAEIGANIKSLRERYAKETSIMNGLTPGLQCPMCKQDITEQNIEAVKKAFADSIAGVLSKGRESTAQLAELAALDKKAKAVFEQFQSDDITKLTADLDALSVEREEILSPPPERSMNAASRCRRQLMDQLKGEIQTLELDIENGNLTTDEAQELARLKQQKDDLAAEITALAKTETASAAEGKAADIDSLKQSIRDKRELETAAKFYIAERNRLMFSEFGALSRVSIVLTETVKTTGEVKDVFKFSYDGKPYKYLSLSEKIKAGIEVAELVKRLSGRNYPLFIDNGESVPVIDNVRPSGQVFIAQVVKGAALKVEIIGQCAAKSQKAA